MVYHLDQFMCYNILIILYYFIRLDNKFKHDEIR